MIRKAIYIQKRQQLLLQQVARARGISEAEIIRQAIEREAATLLAQTRDHDHAAWEEILHVIATRTPSPAPGSPYQWQRQDAYEERERRYDAPTTVPFQKWPL